MCFHLFLVQCKFELMLPLYLQAFLQHMIIFLAKDFHFLDCAPHLYSLLLIPVALKYFDFDFEEPGVVA